MEEFELRIYDFRMLELIMQYCNLPESPMKFSYAQGTDFPDGTIYDVKLTIDTKRYTSPLKQIFLLGEYVGKNHKL